MNILNWRGITPDFATSEFRPSHVTRLLYYGQIGLWVSLICWPLILGLSSQFPYPVNMKFLTTQLLILGPSFILSVYLGQRRSHRTFVLAYIIYTIGMEINWATTVVFSSNHHELLTTSYYIFLPFLGSKYVFYFSLFAFYPVFTRRLLIWDFLFYVSIPLLIDPSAYKQIPAFCAFAFISIAMLIFANYIRSILTDLKLTIDRVEEQSAELSRAHEILTIAVQDSLAALICFDPKGKLALKRGTFADALIGNTVSEVEFLQKVNQNISPIQDAPNDQDFQVVVDDHTFFLISHYRQDLNIYAFIDVTERQKNEAILRESQKLSIVGQLTSGIAHDYNNILAIIASSIESVPLDGNDQLWRDNLRPALNAVRQAKAVSQKLLHYTGAKSSELDTVSLQKAMHDLKPILQFAATDRIQLEINGDDEALILADLHDFETAVLNLVINSRNAIVKNNGNGRIQINYKRGPRANEFTVEIMDEGCGIPIEIQNKIFDPFFSTQDSRHSTGLGLSMVKNFMTQIGGRIEFDSVPGHTSFRLIFKTTNASTQPVQKLHQQEQLKMAPKRVLIVDDNRQLLESTRMLLTVKKIDALTAQNSAEALAHLTRDKNIDIVILDYSMPDQDGIALGKEILAMRPDVKLFLLTGEMDEEDVTLAYSTGFTNVLFKPLFVDDLIAAISSVQSVKPCKEPEAAI